MQDIERMQPLSGEQKTSGALFALFQQTEAGGTAVAAEPKAKPETAEEQPHKEAGEKPFDETAKSAEAEAKAGEGSEKGETGQQKSGGSEKEEEAPEAKAARQKEEAPEEKTAPQAETAEPGQEAEAKPEGEKASRQQEQQPETAGGESGAEEQNGGESGAEEQNGGENEKEAVRSLNAITATFKLTRSLLFSTFEETDKKSGRALLLNTLLVMLLLLSVINLISVFTSYFKLLAAAMVVICLIMAFAVVYVKKTGNDKITEELYAGGAEYTISFTGKGFSIKFPKETKNIRYRDYVKIFEFTKSYSIKYKDNRAFVVPKAAFSMEDRQKLSGFFTDRLGGDYKSYI